MTEYKVIILEEATKEVMMKEQYNKVYQYGEEYNVMCECDEIEIKLKEIDDWNRRKSNIGCGCYKNRRR